MTTDTISVTEFARAAGIPYSTAARWCQPGPGNRVPAEKRDGSWAIPRAEAERVIAQRRKVELDEDRLALALDLMTLTIANRKKAAPEGVARATARLATAYMALSPEQREDLEVLNPLIEPLLRAVEKMREIPLLAGLLDEMNRETRDDEVTPPSDFDSLIEQDRAAVEAKRLEDDRTGDR